MKTDEERRAYGRRWRAAHPESVRASTARSNLKSFHHRRKHLLKSYGLTVEEYASLLDLQGGVCAVCGKEETERTKGSLRRLCVDHDHLTGAVRGLLCNSCNTALGKFNDDRALLVAAVKYLEAFTKREDEVEEDDE